MKIKNEVRYALQIIYYLTLHRDKDIISSNEYQLRRIFQDYFVCV